MHQLDGHAVAAAVGIRRAVQRLMNVANEVDQQAEIPFAAKFVELALWDVGAIFFDLLGDAPAGGAKRAKVRRIGATANVDEVPWPDCRSRHGVGNGSWTRGYTQQLRHMPSGLGRQV